MCMCVCVHSMRAMLFFHSSSLSLLSLSVRLVCMHVFNFFHPSHFLFLSLRLFPFPLSLSLSLFISFFLRLSPYSSPSFCVCVCARSCVVHALQFTSLLPCYFTHPNHTYYMYVHSPSVMCVRTHSPTHPLAHTPPPCLVMCCVHTRTYTKAKHTHVHAFVSV
eukprot:GDKI01015296.1.p1 GENE.GDKI01015296.1~~GDKI01015296.1.p1  ORF type:complete len:163 (+),score=33.88 GDKI01015296.1:293-781(+)